MFEISKPEKILLIADCLTTAGRTPFHIGTLVVETWYVYPDEFGLHGYEQKYPNANVVISAVVGKRGMVVRGWLRKVVENTYALTETGKNHAAAVRNGHKKEVASVNGTHKKRSKDELFLDRLIKTPAHSLDLLENRLAITHSDALEFFGKLSPEELQHRLTKIVESDSSQAGVARAMRHLAEYLVIRFKV